MPFPGDPGLTCQIATDWSSLLDLAPSWASICDAIDFPSPYSVWGYVLTWLELFGLGVKPVFVSVWKDASCIGIIPMFVESVSPLSGKIRRLRQVGWNGELGPRDMTEEPIAMIMPGCEEEVFRSAIASLRKMKDWDALVLRYWADDVEPIRRAVADAGLGAMPLKVKKGPMVVELPETWEAYRKQVTKSMRDNLSYYPRLLTRHGHSWSVQRESDVARGVEELVRLHHMRVADDRASDHEDHIPGQVQSDFLHSVHEKLGPERSFIALMEVDGKVVAAQSFYEDRGTLLVSYSGFDPEWSSYSPLLVLQAQVFREAMERGVRRLDFLQGDRPWQARWKGRCRGTFAHFVMIRLNPLSLLRVLVYGIRHEWAACQRRLLARRSARTRIKSG